MRLAIIALLAVSAIKLEQSKAVFDSHELEAVQSLGPATEGDKAAPKDEKLPPKGDRAPPKGDKAAPKDDKAAPKDDKLPPKALEIPAKAIKTLQIMA